MYDTSKRPQALPSEKAEKKATYLHRKDLGFRV